MHPFWLSFAVFFIMLCIASWDHWWFLRSVRRKFPSLWQDIGRPTGWTDSTLFDAFGTYSYLFQRRYHKRADTDETRFCEQFRMPMLVTYAAAIVSASIFFIGLLVWGKP
jgi:hypothetical protein